MFRHADPGQYIICQTRATLLRCYHTAYSTILYIRPQPNSQNSPPAGARISRCLSSSRTHRRTLGPPPHSASWWAAPRQWRQLRCVPIRRPAGPPHPQRVSIQPERATRAAIRSCAMGWYRPIPTLSSEAVSIKSYSHSYSYSFHYAGGRCGVR